MTPEHLGIGLMGNGKAFTPGLQLFHWVLEGVKINYQSQIISNKNMIWIATKIKKSTTQPKTSITTAYTNKKPSNDTFLELAGKDLSIPTYVGSISGVIFKYNTHK